VAGKLELKHLLAGVVVGERLGLPELLGVMEAVPLLVGLPVAVRLLVGDLLGLVEGSGVPSTARSTAAATGPLK
jgi:hypothetical protein